MEPVPSCLDDHARQARHASPQVAPGYALHPEAEPAPTIREYQLAVVVVRGDGCSDGVPGDRGGDVRSGESVCGAVDAIGACAVERLRDAQVVALMERLAVASRLLGRGVACVKRIAQIGEGPRQDAESLTRESRVAGLQRLYHERVVAGHASRRAMDLAMSPAAGGREAEIAADRHALAHRCAGDRQVEPVRARCRRDHGGPLQDPLTRRQRLGTFCRRVDPPCPGRRSEGQAGDHYEQGDGDCVPASHVTPLRKRRSDVFSAMRKRAGSAATVCRPWRGRVSVGEKLRAVLSTPPRCATKSVGSRRLVIRGGGALVLTAL